MKRRHIDTFEYTPVMKEWEHIPQSKQIVETCFEEEAEDGTVYWVVMRNGVEIERKKIDEADRIYWLLYRDYREG
jgi:hypothetical protein